MGWEVRWRGYGSDIELNADEVRWFSYEPQPLNCSSTTQLAMAINQHK